MTRLLPLQTTARLLPIVLLLSGCSTLQDFVKARSSVEVPPAVPLVERERFDPLDANRFELLADDQDVIGEPQMVFTRASDTFSYLAREYGLGYDELVAANPGVDPWLPGEDTPVVLPTQYVLPDAPRTGIVLNIASKRLFYFPEPEAEEPAVVLTYPIGIGRVGWETPLGEASVISKARDPKWYPPASVRKEHAELGDPLPAIVPAGPDNPLGRFVLKLDMPGYLIHGTNQPYGVGMRVSHGCVRLYPENIETLYPLVALGAAVSIVNQPYLLGHLDGEPVFEAHVPLEDDEVSPEDHLARILERIDSPLENEQLATLNGYIAAIASTGSGVPLQVNRLDSEEVLGRTRLVYNTVEPDPEAPTLAEVRELLDTPLDELDAAAGTSDAANDANHNE